MIPRNYFRACAVASITLVFSFFALGHSQQDRMSDVQRDTAVKMIEAVHDTVKTSYYDPRFHNMDFEARYKAAKEKVTHADTLSEVYGITAWMLEVLDDSHTFFLPPARPYKVENGWRMQFVGDRCLITAVKPESDAQRQGLKPGDQLLSMEGFPLKRATAWKLQYAFEVLAPRSATRIVSASPDGEQRELLVKADVEKLPKVLELGFDQRDPDTLGMSAWRLIDMGDPLMIWKMPGFRFDDREVDRFVAAAKKHQALILDLRGNPGGAEPTMVRMLGSFLDHDVQIGERVTRSPEKPLVAKTLGSGKIFSGKLVVLIDSRSASAAEIFSRVIQLEKRGIVLGDRSSGSVMEARTYHGQVGEFSGIPYGVEVTVGNLIMADGVSLEHSGVTPDEIILPTGEDLAAGRDPVLARAANLAGVELTSEKAGAIFPTIWLNPKQ